MGYRFAPAPLPGARNYWTPTHFINWPDSSVQAMRTAIGNNASVSAQGNIGAYFSQRGQIYAYPQKLDDVEAVVLRLESPTKKLLPKEPIYTASLASHLQMRPADYLASIECTLSDDKFGITFWSDPWLVFSRGTMTPTALRHEVETKILGLRQEWEINMNEYVAALKTCKK